MIVDDLERITVANARSFYRDYVTRSRPVVITDFLTSDGMARAREIGMACRPATSPDAIDPARMFDQQTLIELLDARQRATVWTAAPDDLRALLAQRLEGLPFEHDMVSELWGGRQGGETLFHYDLDMRANVLVQLFGHKRVAIADPEHTQKLEPFLHGHRPQFSSRFVTAHDEHDRRHFLAFVGARETVLGPGEALFIPALHWHQVEYIDTTLSITLRLGRDPWLAWLAGIVSRMWPVEVSLLQGIAARCFTEDGPHPRLAELRDAFEAACARTEHDARFLAVLHELHAELCPGRFTRPFSERDAAYFEHSDRARRPPVTMPVRWESTSIPWLAPGYEIVEVLDHRKGGEFRILSCASTVIARLSVPSDARKPIRELLRLVARRGSSTVDELADKAGLDAAQLLELLRGWSRREWIVDGRT